MAIPDPSETMKALEKLTSAEHAAILIEQAEQRFHTNHNLKAAQMCIHNQRKLVPAAKRRALDRQLIDQLLDLYFEALDQYQSGDAT